MAFRKLILVGDSLQPFIAPDTTKNQEIIDNLEEKPVKSNVQRIGKFNSRKPRPRTMLLILGIVFEATKLSSAPEELLSL